MENEKRNSRRWLPNTYWQIGIEIAVLLIVLYGFGLLLQSRVEGLLNNTVEVSVSRQAADIDALAEERFKHEHEALHTAAILIVGHPEQEQAMLSALESETPGARVLHIRAHDELTQADVINYQDYRQLEDAFQGQNIVDYCAGKGLLFAVPMRKGNAVTGILCRLYPESVMTDSFTMEALGSQARFLIRERAGGIMVPYRGYSERDEKFLGSPSVRDGFEVLEKKLKTNRSAVIYVETEDTTFSPDGRYYLFGANLSGTNGVLFGFVPWHEVAGEITYIYQTIIVIFYLLLLLFAIVGTYLFYVQAKATESDALRRARDEAERLRIVAERANHAKSDFLANMSHEIRTPLNSIAGLNEMILRESGEKGIRRYASEVRNASSTLMGLINDILDFSKIESGELQIVHAPYQLSQLIHEVVLMIRPRAEKKGLEFIVDVDKELPENLIGDVMRLRQVLINFLSNAVKYTPTGKVMLIVRGEKKGGTEVEMQFTVQDTGIGIRPEDQGKIFEGFKRVDLIRNRNIQGTGLGMAITKRLVEAMQGTITLQSIYGQGSSFTAVLPQQRQDDELVGDYLASPEDNEADAYRPRFVAPEANVLVVDDNEINRFVVANLLKQTLVHIDMAENGEECLKLTRAHHYDLVLLDQMMPGMSGIETLQKARTQKGSPCADTPFVILTADAIAGSREKFVAAGFSDYLSKPVDGRKLEEVVEKYLPTRLVHHPDAES